MNTEKEQKEIEEKWQTERLEKQINFIREMDKEKFIGRQTYLSDGKRKENDAEHAWHLALMTLLLSEYANEKIDTLKTMTMVLFHDVVEIDAGDTYAYDEEGKKTQAQREQKAAERLYGLLPEDQGAKLKAIWEEFEAKNTPESRFAHTMDKPSASYFECGHRRKGMERTSSTPKPVYGPTGRYAKGLRNTLEI